MRILARSRKLEAHSIDLRPPCLPSKYRQVIPGFIPVCGSQAGVCRPGRHKSGDFDNLPSGTCLREPAFENLRQLRQLRQNR